MVSFQEIDENVPFFEHLARISRDRFRGSVDIAIHLRSMSMTVESLSPAPDRRLRVLTRPD